MLEIGPFNPPVGEELTFGGASLKIIEKLI
jgi:hypothetical protein